MAYCKDIATLSFLNELVSGFGNNFPNCLNELKGLEINLCRKIPLILPDFPL